MSDWRERGEVPDSQEESDDYFSDVETRLPVRVSVAEAQSTNDIWAFPGSDDDEQGNIPSAADVPSFATRTSTRERSGSVTIPLALAEENLESQEQLSPPKHSETIFSSPSAPSHDEVAFRNNQDTADAPSLTNGNATVTNSHHAASFTSTSAASGERPTTTGANEVHHHAADVETADATARHGRRLRPRNLIQEKPYFYDRVNYSNTFRKHGLIPVNVITETERHRSPEASSEAASWDGDYDQDSQDIDIPPGTDTADAGGFTAPLQEHAMPDADQPFPRIPQPPARTIAASFPSSPTTAADDDQDLPDLDQLLGRPPITRSQSPMRDASQVQTSTHRFRRRDIIYSDSPEPFSGVGRKPKSAGSFPDWSDSDAQQSAPTEVVNRQESSPKTPSRPSSSDSVVSISSQEIERQDEHSRQGSQEASESGSEAESDTHQVVTQFRRRIRGVLPASWLRLDQQTSKSGSGRSPRRRPRHQVAHQRQRGIALTKTVTNNVLSSTTIPLTLDEDSPPAQYMTDDMPERQYRMTPSQNPERENEGLSDDSVVEEDHISPAVVGSKRQLRLPQAVKRDRKRAKVSIGSRSRFVQVPSKQQAITGFLHPQSSDVPSPLPADYPSDVSQRMSNKPRQNAIRRPKRRPQSPVLLSILDTIEPDAPRFMRIAARSARQTLNQGRSSVQQKCIKLAARQDQVDVLSVMEEWKTGLIKQRPSVTEAHRSNHKRHQIAEETKKYSNGGFSSSTFFSTSRGTCRKLVKCRGERGSVSYRRSDPDTGVDTNLAPTVGVDSFSPSPAIRMAQLEVGEKAKGAMVSFRSRKGALDRIFNQQRQEKPALRLAENLNTASRSHSMTEDYTMGHTPSRISPGQEQRQRPPRLRKSRKPSRVDVTAPQYIHADDPLPVGSSVFAADAPLEKSKLYGLGPYGTRYTHHFEIFPLSPGLQFHTSTLLGSGVFKALVEDSQIGKTQLNSQSSVSLGDHVFNLGPWTPNVSSEIGLFFDTLAGSVFDILAGPLEESQWEEVIRGTISATHCVFEYVQKVLDSAETEPLTPPFLPRLQEVLDGFIRRLDNGLAQSSFLHAVHRQLILNLLDRVLLMSFAMTRHCQYMSQLLDERSQQQTFMLLPARLVISVLLRCGLDPIKQVYKDVSRLHRRDRFLEQSAVEVHSWTMLIKTFEHANSRQLSFWGALETAILTPELLSGTNAPELERIWETMFTLLPLFEFDDSGRIVPKKRYTAENEGWSIPQKLIRRVFQLYQDNEQQPASFNSYCRALISRCHYLVRQWGWLRSASVVGVIFDFFGSRSLAHLRNEEVYQSPRFLEKLAAEPVLEIEADDFCFHIFLKLLAISIKNLQQFGSHKDIRNLVARTIPNHNRLYLKEHTIHERDLAALRNHHDLIGTLFWAAPPEIRPSVSIIEKLVDAASSHKEACLINIRAWAQLARFVVSSGEARSSFKPFEEWRDSIFQQMLVQFGNIAADVHLQQVNLSEDKSNCITQSVVDTTIKKNKAAVMDVVHLSLTASLDVMRCASDLEAATICLSSRHLKQVFDYFRVSPFELDWSILRTALTILDTYVSRIEDFKASHHSQQSESQLLESAQADEAFCALGQEIAHSYFSMARCILSLSTEVSGFRGSATADKAWCVRQVTTLSARMGIGFINGSLMINGGLFKLSEMFKSGNYYLFSSQLQAMDPSHRQHLLLFISTLLRHEFDDFSDVDFNICEVWVLALVMPIEYVRYENLVDIQRYCYAKGFIPDRMANLPAQPNYKTNHRLFEFAISSMRKELRRADPHARRVLSIEYSRILKLVMKQMRSDLGVTLENAPQHQRYVEFVQGIISSIKTHGSDICTIDSFFLQSSREYYHPPIQDPQLQIAGMLSYGIRIEEGDPRAAHELFYLLFNNFKHALRKGNLAHDVRMLCEGMKHRSILAFVLGKMLPAILGVSFLDSSSFTLLDVYTKALCRLLRGAILPRQLDSDDLPYVLVTIRAIVEGMRSMCLRSEVLSGSQLHILRQALVISNALWPSLLIVNAERPRDLCLVDIATAMRHIASFATVAQDYLQDLIEMSSVDSPYADLLFRGLEVEQPPVLDEHVRSFTVNMKDDIAKTWIFGPERISIHMPTKAKGLAQEEGHGVKPPNWVVEDIVRDIYNQIQHWCWQWSELR
ncbi:Protein mms22 [Trichoderma ghanense]|uniref:Protein mms22 n=1 Tax=Trichoderma ghanense TaxID=65468 RepID=A0ABY2GY08_9HYPO